MSRSIQIGDFVDLSPPIYNDTFIIQQIVNNEIYIAPVNQPTKISKLILINEKWRVFGVENIDFQFNFRMALPQIQQFKSPVILPPMVQPIVQSMVQISHINNQTTNIDNIGARISESSIRYYGENPSDFIQIGEGRYPRVVHFKNHSTDDFVLLNEPNRLYMTHLIGSNDIVAPQTIWLRFMFMEGDTLEQLIGTNWRGINRLELVQHIDRTIRTAIENGIESEEDAIFYKLQNITYDETEVIRNETRHIYDVDFITH